MFSPQSLQHCSVMAVFCLISLLNVFKRAFLHLKTHIFFSLLRFFFFFFQSRKTFIARVKQTQMFIDSPNEQAFSAFSNLAKWTFLKSLSTKRSSEETVLKYSDGPELISTITNIAGHLLYARYHSVHFNYLILSSQ